MYVASPTTPTAALVVAALLVVVPKWLWQPWWLLSFTSSSQRRPLGLIESAIIGLGIFLLVSYQPCLLHHHLRPPLHCAPAHFAQADDAMWMFHPASSATLIGFADPAHCAHEYTSFEDIKDPAIQTAMHDVHQHEAYMHVQPMPMPLVAASVHDSCAETQLQSAMRKTPQPSDHCSLWCTCKSMWHISSTCDIAFGADASASAAPMA